MSRRQMPARIWCDDIDVSLCNRALSTFARTSYTRSDIAERMAEALEALVQSADDLSWSANLSMADRSIEAARFALSAFRSATQDTEARHD